MLANVKWLILILMPVVAAVSLGASMKTAVNVRLVGMKPGRPPLQYLSVDVDVKNDESQPLWVLIPSRVPEMSGGIDTLEQYTAKAGATNLAVGRFLGSGGRYAVRLAPGAHLTLRKLEVGWWTAGDPKDIVFDFRFATAVMLGSEPMAAWFDTDPTIRGAVEVDMSAARHTATHRSAGNKEVPLTATAAETTSIKVSAH
jgi:hypothetical protein